MSKIKDILFEIVDILEHINNGYNEEEIRDKIHSVAWLINDLKEDEDEGEDYCE
jgi:hypothetical protein